MSKFGTYQLPKDNHAATAIARVEALMAQEHWVFVKEVLTSSSILFRVWKSPGEFNSANQDFYMSLWRPNSISTANFGVRTFRDFDPSNNTMTGYHIDSSAYDAAPLTSPTWRPSALNAPVPLDQRSNSTYLDYDESLTIASGDLLWARVTPDFVQAFVGSSKIILTGGLYTPAADYSEWLTTKGFREDFVPLCQGVLNVDNTSYFRFSTSSVGNPTFEWGTNTGKTVSRIGGTPSDITQPGRLSRYPLASLYALRQKDSITKAFVDIGYLPGIAMVYVPITVGRGDKVDITIGSLTETYVIATDGAAGYRSAMSIGYLED